MQLKTENYFYIFCIFVCARYILQYGFFDFKSIIKLIKLMCLWEAVQMFKCCKVAWYSKIIWLVVFK